MDPTSKISEMAERDTSRAESVDVLSMKPPDPPTESTQRDSEPSWKWVKRLQANPLESIPLSAKRFKLGDTSSSGETQDLLTRVVNYNRSISDLPECQQLDKTTFVPKNSECFPGDSTKLIPWIRRWCRRSQETVPSTPVLCEPGNSKVLPEKFEAKQFPSLAAMALMGKQVTNFRPCEFRRRESTTVWNI